MQQREKARGKRMNMTERRGSAAVSWFRTTKPHKLYEDRYRLLTRDIPLVGKSARGEIYGVFDGIGSAPMGMAAAQAMADAMTDFFRKPDDYPADWHGMSRLLHEANCTISEWGFMEGRIAPSVVAPGLLPGSTTASSFSSMPAIQPRYFSGRTGSRRY
jgi:hypothetical protein